MLGTQLLVGMAEIQVSKEGPLFVCLGLGSCIGLAAYDPVARVAGMVHVMLPAAFADKPVDKPGKFADTGVSAMLEQMARLGASKSRIVVAMAGGAQVFNFGSGNSGRLDIGKRNADAVEEQVRLLGLRCLGKDVGGNQGRTMTFDSGSGLVKVRTVTSMERALCNLRGS
ncbi:MAG: chemotaxis protein CheD [Fimbriimonadales bacterium]|nr:chemotaxis protein CheD [Fimbriimonadales bacterium]